MTSQDNEVLEYKSMYDCHDIEKLNGEWILLKITKKMIDDAFGPTKKKIPYDKIMKDAIREYINEVDWRFWGFFDDAIENYGGKPNKDMKTGKRVNTWMEQAKEEKQETRLDPQLKRKLK